MRKLVLILIAIIAAATFIRSWEGPLKAEEQAVDSGAAAAMPNSQAK
ncbi:MAG: hypothetical protein LBD86_07055 [Spirochaetaceae bacterium]|nr:hypothetical protein [Spirochaetaceae bacterium]